MTEKINFRRSSRKGITLLVILTLILGLFTGCNQNIETSDKLSVLCVGFAEYDWTLNILGELKDEAEVSYLLGGGVDIHSYQPSTKDIVSLNMADVVIYSGGTSEEWIDAIAKEREASERLRTIDLMDVLKDSLLEEELVEGMEEEEGEEEEECEIDEHIWLSLRNAEECCYAIEKVLAEVDRENASIYEANCQAYTEKLSKMDKNTETFVEEASKDTLVFGDRFPFRYLMEDYGLNYYAAFPGCSADSEASFETIIFLAGKCDSIHAKTVIRLEGPDLAIASAVAENSKVKPEIKVMNSMQSVSEKDIGEGASYISIMEKNLAVLKDALN